MPHLAATRLLARVLALALIIASVGACAGDATPSGSGIGPPNGAIATLAGTSWIVLSVGGRTPLAGAVPTVTFDVDRVGGTGGCNQFGGSYRFDASTGQLEVRQLLSTEMGCLQPEVSDFEALFLKALGGARQVSMDPTGQLVLDGAAGRIVLVHLEHPAVSS